MSTKREHRLRQLERTHDRIETCLGTHYYVPKKSEAERSMERVEKARQAEESFFDWYYGEGGSADGDGGPDEG